MARMLYANIESVSIPCTGDVLIDKYWCVCPRRGIAFYERLKVGNFDLDRLSPQCNSSKSVADLVVAKREGHIVQKIPAVYMGKITEKQLTI